MSVFKRQNTSNYAYSKIHKEDPEETRHRKAQFLIYKAMEEAAETAGSRQKRTTMSSFLRMKFCKVKVKIGSRFKSLRRRMAVTKAATYMQIIKQVRSCKRLIGGGREDNVAGGLPSLLI